MTLRLLWPQWQGAGTSSVTELAAELLPATVSPDRVALARLHAWTGDDFPNIAAWGIRSFSPDSLRETTRPLLDWLAATGCPKVAIHFDVDTIDSNELMLGLGAEPGGRRSMASLTSSPA